MSGKTDTSRYDALWLAYNRAHAFNERIRKRVRRRVNKTHEGKVYWKSKRKYQTTKFLRTAIPIIVRAIILLAMLVGPVLLQINYFSTIYDATADVFPAVLLASTACSLFAAAVFFIIEHLDSANKIFLSNTTIERLGSSIFLWLCFATVTFIIALGGFFFFYKWWEALIAILFLPIAFLLSVIKGIFNIKDARGAFLQVLYCILILAALTIAISWVDYLVGIWTSKWAKSWLDAPKMHKLERAYNDAYAMYTQSVDKLLKNESLEDEDSLLASLKAEYNSIDWGAIAAMQQRAQAKKEIERTIAKFEKHMSTMERYAATSEQQRRDTINGIEKGNRQLGEIHTSIERLRNK